MHKFNKKLLGVAYPVEMSGTLYVVMIIVVFIFYVTKPVSWIGYNIVERAPHIFDRWYS